MLPKYTYYAILLLLFISMALRVIEFGDFAIATILNMYLWYISETLGKMRMDKNAT